jgi:hypothetical protein
MQGTVSKHIIYLILSLGFFSDDFCFCTHVSSQFYLYLFYASSEYSPTLLLFFVYNTPLYKTHILSLSTSCLQFLQLNLVCVALLLPSLAFPRVRIDTFYNTHAYTMCCTNIGMLLTDTITYWIPNFDTRRWTNLSW